MGKDDEVFEEKIKVWEEYLDWIENVSKYSIKGYKYINFGYINRNQKNIRIFFDVHLESKKVSEFEKFIKTEKIEIYENDYLEKLRTNKNFNEVVTGLNLVEIKDIKIENIDLKKVNDFKNIKNNESVVKRIIYECNEQYIPQSGMLSISFRGTQVSINRQREAIEKLKYCDENVQKSNIKKWLFNIKNTDDNFLDEEFNNDIFLTEKVLNRAQKKAINGIVNSKEVYLIQGPPGTGKTTVIAEGIYQLVKKNKRVLIASQTNLAVDNVLERLEIDSAIRAIRFGSDEKISSTAKKFTKENILKNYYDAIKEAVEKETGSIGVQKDLLKKMFEYLDLSIEYAKKIKVVKNDNAFEYLEDTRNELRGKEKIQKQIELLMKDWIKRLTDESLLTDDKEFFLEYYIKSCNVVGISCTASAKDLEKYELEDFDVVIIDEVSKATLPELLITMVRGKKIVLVGDYKQLNAVFSVNRKEYEILTKEFENELNREYYSKEKFNEYEEMIKKSLFEEYFSHRNKKIMTILDTQYRMDKEIQDVVNIFYDNQLKCSVKSKKHNINIKGKNDISFLDDNTHILWIDTMNKEKGIPIYEERDGNSKFNLGEAEAIVKTLEKINRECKSGVQKAKEIAVISVYSAQVKKIKNIIDKKKLGNLNIEVNTVDSFQGKEKDIVLVSLVANPRNKKNISEHLKNYKRINVAFSRARELLIIYGAGKCYEDLDIKYGNNQRKLYKEIIKNLKSKDKYKKVEDLF